MEYRILTTPLGPMVALAGEGRLVRLDFADSPYALRVAGPEGTDPALREAERWLDAYFAGERPPVPADLSPAGTTFQKTVWGLLREIPWGASRTYGELAAELIRREGRSASARAVGQAVGRNPLSLMIPCHRVLGRNGALTGYAGGKERKRALLRLEGITFTE